MITTFADLITKATSRKIFLVEVEPSERIVSWTNYSGDIYYNDIGNYDVQSVVQDSTTLTESTTLAGMSAGKWYYKTGRLYVQVTSGNIYAKTIVANYKLYWTNENAVVFNDHYYEPVVGAIPTISQKKTDFFWGVSIQGGGSISIINDGQFDEIYNRFAWGNKPITILAGGEDLPYSQYQEQFKGKIDQKHLGMKLFDLSFIDAKTVWDTNLPLNSFSQSVYTWLDDADVGRPLPYAWGTIKRAPVVCVTQAKGTATNTHLFKICDTSLHSITSIDQVYVDGVKVNHVSGSISAATFKLSSTVFEPGKAVAVDFVGYKSGSTTIHNPVSILKEIGSSVKILNIPYNSTNWDTATVSQAITDAEDYPIGLFMAERQTAIDTAGEIMKSCLGTLFNNIAGKYSIKIWSTDVPVNPDEISDLEIFEDVITFDAVTDEIRKTCIVGWRKAYDSGEYAYLQKSSDITEPLYGITKSKTVETLLSTSNGATVYLDRLVVLLETETNRIQFTIKLQLALKNIGDRINLTFKRNDKSGNITWLDSKLIEIQEMVKDFTKGEVRITADDLKGIGGLIGHWTDDTLTFPVNLGGGSGDPWDKTWSAAKKAYAKATWGYWCDDNGYADPTDPDSFNISRWW